MSLEDVKNDILEEAETNALDIVKDAETIALSIKKDAEKQADERESSFKASLNERIIHLTKKELSLAKLEAKKEIFEAKKRCMLNAIESAKSKLGSMPKKENEKLINELVSKAEKNMPLAFVYCNAKEEEIVKAALKSKAKVIKADMLGGIIAENADKSMRIDFSYESLLADLYDKVLNKLADILF